MADCYSALDVMYGRRDRFYLFVTIYGWFCIIFLYVCFLLMLTRKVNLPAVISDVKIVVSFSHDFKETSIISAECTIELVMGAACCKLSCLFN